MQGGYGAPYGAQPGTPHGPPGYPPPAYGPPGAAPPAAPGGPSAPTPRAAQTLDLALRFFLSIIFTPFMVAIAISTQQYQLLAVLVVTLAVVSALGGGHGLLERFPAMGRVKLLGGLLRLTGDLDGFYRQHPPRSFLFYVVYPAYAVIGAIVSPVTRREIWLHVRILLAVTVLIVVDLGASYGRLYPPYLGVGDAAKLLVVQLTLVVFASAVYLMPMVTTVYAFGADRLKNVRRLLVVGSVLLSVPFGYGAWTKTHGELPWLERGRLSARLAKPEFRGHLELEADMYLGWADAKGAFADVGETPAVLPSEDLQRLVRGMVAGTEERAFSLVAMKGPGGAWSAVRMLQVKRPFLLVVRAPDGHVVTHWADLPPEVAAKFELGNATWKDRDASHVAARTLLDDLP